MRIVYIGDFFHPDAGYQINILAKHQVKQGHEVSIVTSEIEKSPKSVREFFGEDNIEERDKQYSENTGVKIYRRPTYGCFSNRAIYKLGLKKFVDTLNPDVLYVNGNDTAIGILYSLRAGKLLYPIVLDSHMLEMASKNPLNKLFRVCYKYFIAPAIKKKRLIVIRTQNDDYVERCLNIPLSQSPCISVGSDTMLFFPDSAQKSKFRNDYNIYDSDFVVIYAGKLEESKGGKLLAEAFKKKFNPSSGKKVVLIVVGNKANGDYGEKVEKIFNQSKNRILRFPTQRYIDLARFFQASDLSVFPKQCSLSFYDAQACGLPVVSEDNNINIDRLKYGNGLNFRLGDAEDFRKKIMYYIELDDEKFNKIKENAHNFVVNNYDYKVIAQRYTDILIQEIKRFEKEKGCMRTL